MRLTGKVALVTGGGAGIGRSIALRFAQEGAKVMVADVGRLPGGEGTVKDIKSTGGEASFVQGDVSKAADAERMVKTTVEVYGGIDILVNNAGVYFKKALSETTESEWDRLISVNIRGVFLCSKYAIPQLTKRGGGVIINLSSVGGLVGTPFLTAYCTSKGGVLLLTKALSEELKPQNIRVNALCPAVIDTDMGRAVIKDRPATGGPPQIGRPEDVANAALFLASDESSFITGNGLVVGPAGNTSSPR